jgi:hypothetical protein
MYTIKPGMVVHTYNPSTWEAEAGGLSLKSKPGLQSESKSLYSPTPQKKRKEKEKKEQPGASIFGRLKSGGLWFKANSGKKAFATPSQ